MKKAIFVTQPHLPPLDEFIPYLQQIWDSKTLTNNGPFHQQLEQELCDFLGVEHLSLFTNGTIALVTALQTLRITGEVITTPYSFVATAHSVLWNALRPVFVDIEANTFNLDPGKVEQAITPHTTAILPVHTYGTPCSVAEIQNIADRYGLKVIYDAAHAFGVRLNNQSILRYGDLSVLSFHATKVFNTFEGGAIVCPDAKTKQRIDYLKNFGFADEVTVTAPGINGKMSEINAAFGILQLKYIDEVIAARRVLDLRYREAIGSLTGVTCLRRSDDIAHNYSYFPILIGNGYPVDRDALYDRLRKSGIYARRYFYPLISDMPMYRGLASAEAANLPVAKLISQQVLCLPIYPAMTESEQWSIIEVVRNPLSS